VPTWKILVGIFAMPISMLLFWGLSRAFRHPNRPKHAVLWVLSNGVMAYVVAMTVFLYTSMDLSVYAYLAYAAAASCYLRWVPPWSLKRRRVERELEGHAKEP
jgi:hypothetical protein